MRKLNISVKVKAVLDKLNRDNLVLVKGLYEVKMPWKLSTEDKYKYPLVVLFENNFRPQSAEVLEKVGLTYTVLKKKNVEKDDVKGIKLESCFINKSNGNKTVKKQGNCVMDYVWL